MNFTDEGTRAPSQEGMVSVVTPPSHVLLLIKAVQGDLDLTEV